MVYYVASLTPKVLDFCRSRPSMGPMGCMGGNRSFLAGGNSWKASFEDPPGRLGINCWAVYAGLVSHPALFLSRMEYPDSVEGRCINGKPKARNVVNPRYMSMCFA